MNFKAVLALPKTACSAQTHKSISFIWIVWSTLYVLCISLVGSQKFVKRLSIALIGLLKNQLFPCPRVWELFISVQMKNSNWWGSVVLVFCLKKCSDLLIKKCSKAVTNYHVRNGRAQKSLLFPCQCRKISLNHWSMVWSGLLPRIFSYYQLLLFYVAPLINDSNCFYGIGRVNVMNSAHGRYRRDSLSVL